MKTRLTLSLVLALFVAACSTPDDRVSKKQSQFNSWPVAVQQNVKIGQIALGYTQEQVWVALGEADRKYTRTTEKGTQEIWAYLSHAPRLSIGFGVGGGNVGGGVAVSSRGDHDDEVKRVIFSDGVVSAIEESKAN